MAETDTKLAAIQNAQVSFAAFMEAQQKINAKVEAHISDKTIHVTDDAIKNLVAAQLTPLMTSLSKLEVTVDGQQRSLTRLEDLQAKMLDILQKQQITNARGEGR